MAQCRSCLERVAAALAGGDRVRRLVRAGEPASVLMAAAEETDADLIALSTHGRTGLARLVLGAWPNKCCTVARV